MTTLAIVLDDYALDAVPGLERDLAHAGAFVMRSFRGLPNPNLLRRYRGAAVVGGADRSALISRLETASATIAAPVIAVLPPGVPPAAELRGPGVVDLMPARSPGAAERILLMARVPIVSGRHAARAGLVASPADSAPAQSPAPALRPAPACLPPPAGPAASELAAELVAIASSTGGVWVLAALLRDLPARGRAVVVAQHMEGEFVPFFADWIQGVTGWRTVLVSGPVPWAAGTVYLPAGGLDLSVEDGALRGVPPALRYVPSGDRLLRTAASAAGPDAVGLVLSGMGSDGAEGLAEIVRRGGRALCQDPASAAVPSMPESALRRVPSALAVPPEALARAVAHPLTEGAGRPPPTVRT